MTYQKYQEIIKQGYNLDIIYILGLINDNCDISFEENIKIKAIWQSIIRKGLIGDNQKLTTRGIELLNFYNSEEMITFVKKKIPVQDFEEWWKAFPGTDSFSHKGKVFTGSRALKMKKEDCHIKFKNIILEGEYTAKQLIEALNFDVLQKKEASYKENTNKLKYMQNSLTYLNQRSYECFIELIENNMHVIEFKENYDGANF